MIAIAVKMQCNGVTNLFYSCLVNVIIFCKAATSLEVHQNATRMKDFFGEFHLAYEFLFDFNRLPNYQIFKTRSIFLT